MAQAPRPNLPDENDLLLMDGNTLIAKHHTSPKDKYEGTLIYWIIWCESRFSPTAQNPKSTAYGLCQFLDATWEYVQNKWGIILDRDNEEDQFYACERLLKEEGTSHWKSTQWCWEK